MQSVSDSKHCSKCKSWKPYSEFSKDRHQGDGHTCQCKECKKDYVQANREKLNEYQSQWAKNNPDKRRKYARAWTERNPDYRRRWQAENPERGREAVRKWRSVPENAEKSRAYTRKWHRENLVASAIQSHNRRARMASNRGVLTEAQWEAMQEFYDGSCLCCGSRETLSPDHVVPVAKGGFNGPTNIQPLCGPCNRKKNAKFTNYRDSYLHAELLAAMFSEDLL